MAEQRYQVLKRLEAGGMAEVYVGEAQSVQGFKKKVAIKRVLPHLAQNENFIGMFLDEARLGARLNHANIVSVFDIGAADGTFFIVMEYVDGCNLKTVIEALRKEGRPFPLNEALYLCMEACRGLSYAHDLTDDDGNPLHIVHRDVSPPNILLSRRGEVKMTDFGLAKASTQLEKTDPGVVKGKFSYLAPEAAMGEPVDERADVFAMGIVLWEMLAGRRLFLGENDFQTVKLVQKAEVPSLRRLNPEVDEEFEGILLKGLARDPAQRFLSAREFGDAIAGYLFGHGLKVTSYDIAALVKHILSDSKPEISAQRSIIDKLIQDELLSFTSLDDFAAAQPIGVEASHDGAMPLDAGAFENPTEWFKDDAELGGEPWEDSIAQQLPGGVGWRDSGVEALREDTGSQPLDEVFGDDAPTTIHAPLLSEPPSAPPPPLASRSDSISPSSMPPKSGSSWLGIAAMVLLLLAGAGAYIAFFR